MNIFLCVMFFISVASSAKLDNRYLPPNSANAAGGNENNLHIPKEDYNGSVNVEGEGRYTIASVDNLSFDANIENVNPTVPVVNSKNRHSQPSPTYGPAQTINFQRSTSPEAHTNILRFDNDNDGNGNYHFDFETENKIRHEEHGQLKEVGDGEAVVVQGSYSYIGDDEKTYTVTYIADENGFQPAGEHIDEAIARTASEAAKSATPNIHHEQYNNDNQRGELKNQDISIGQVNGYK